MKKSLSFALLATLTFGSVSASALAKAPKTDARAAAIVAALTAVSPDPMGGQIGLAVATARVNERGLSTQTSVAVSSPSDPSRRTFAAGKLANR